MRILILNNFSLFFLTSWVLFGAWVGFAADQGSLFKDDLFKERFDHYTGDHFNALSDSFPKHPKKKVMEIKDYAFLGGLLPKLYSHLKENSPAWRAILPREMNFSNKYCFVLGPLEKFLKNRHDPQLQHAMMWLSYLSAASGLTAKDWALIRSFFVDYAFGEMPGLLSEQQKSEIHALWQKFLGNLLDIISDLSAEWKTTITLRAGFYDFQRETLIIEKALMKNYKGKHLSSKNNQIPLDKIKSVVLEDTVVLVHTESEVEGESKPNPFEFKSLEKARRFAAELRIQLYLYKQEIYLPDSNRNCQQQSLIDHWLLDDNHQDNLNAIGTTSRKLHPSFSDSYVSRSPRGDNGEAGRLAHSAPGLDVPSSHAISIGKQEESQSLMSASTNTSPVENHKIHRDKKTVSRRKSRPKSVPTEHGLREKVLFANETSLHGDKDANAEHKTEERTIPPLNLSNVPEKNTKSFFPQRNKKNQ